jgi:recombination DNA repair RAD52 pathway protein
LLLEKFNEELSNKLYQKSSVEKIDKFKNEIIQIMKKSNLYNVNSSSTYERRSSTIKGWINWIVELINE